ncbi:MAG TPA: VWA domain-containing protein [Vicinamibacterales bacterium]|nr:VWA domain-containing protein [Vicinamibacterales bacterium]
MPRLILALALLAATPAAGVQNPSDPAPARLLKIDAVALDRNDSPVPDLRKDELEVWIGRFRIPIETLDVVTPKDPERSRRSIVLLLDDLTLAPELISRTRAVARRFVNRMAPGDEMAVIGLNGGATKSTGDPAPLLGTIDAYNVRPSGLVRPDDVAAHVLTTITAISRQLAEAPARRRTIVGIGASWLFDTPIPAPSTGRTLRPEWVEAMRAMASSNVTLYAIDPRGVGMAPAAGGASGFARDTGGLAFVNTNDLDGAVDRILRETTTYYTISVVDPPVFRTADLRELDVRVLRRGITVRARRAIPGR